MKKLVAAGLLVVLCLALLHALAFGALFPWSPVKPGYSAHRFDRAVLYAPHAYTLPPGLSDLDALLGQVEADNRLTFGAPLKIVVTDTWAQFNRGALLGFGGTPLPVLGAALQTGTVVYLSPLVHEPARDAAAVLRHELVHALMFQQLPLKETFALVRLDWFEEGLAVLYGNPRDYMSDAEWQAAAGGAAYRAGLLAPHVPPGLAPEDYSRFRLAEYRLFMTYLQKRFGNTRFFRWRDRVLDQPEDPAHAFEEVLDTPMPVVVADFEEAVRTGFFPLEVAGASTRSEP